MHVHYSYYRTIRRTRRLRLKPIASDSEYVIPQSWKSIWLDYAAEVFRNTTLQGFVHFTHKSRHPLEHLFWFLCIAVAVGCVVTLSMSTWTRYRESPTVISLENNYRDWNISFVAVYICPNRTVNETRLMETSEELANSTGSNDVERLERFINTLAGLTHEKLKDLKEFAGYTLIQPSEYLDLVYKVKYDLTYYSGKEDEYDDIDDDDEEEQEKDTKEPLLREVWTDCGRCYSYNSQIAKPNNKSRPVIVKSYLESGIPTRIQDINSGFTAYFKGSREVPGIADPKLNNSYMSKSTVDLKVMITYATEAVRQLDVDHRRCRFWDESNLEVSPLYTVNLCYGQCRAKLAIKLCGCAPFFYVGVQQARYNICDVQGMLCLAQHVGALTSVGKRKDATAHPCGCYPTCESDEYAIEETETSPGNEDTGNTAVEFRVQNYPTVRMKRDILFTLPDMLVAFGGAAAFFLGCSVLSVVEVFYYLTLRLFFHLHDVRHSRRVHDQRNATQKR